MHELLEQQIRLHFGDPERVPQNLGDFLMSVSATYEHFDEERMVIQRSLPFGSGGFNIQLGGDKTKREQLKLQELAEKNILLEKTKLAMANILEDVTESHKELQMKTEELVRFQQAVETSFNHVVIADIDGRVLYANRAAEIMTGYSREEMIGKTPALWGKQMSKEFYETMWQTIKTEKNSYAGELTNKRKDGSTYLATLRVVPILNQAREIQFFVGIERDITEERESQLKIVRHAAELEQANAHIAEEKQRAEGILRFLKSIGEAVFATDGEAKIIFMNEAAELLSGRTFDEVAGTVSSDTFYFTEKSAQGSERLRITRRVLTEKKTYVFPAKTFIVGGEKEVPVSGTCSLIRDENQRIVGTITVFQDITKKHELDQMKDSFLSVAAHQLRTPLGGMRWNMELLLNGDLGRLPKQAKEAVQQIYDNSQRMVILVNDLLSVSRMDQNRGREEKTPIDVHRVLENVVKAMQPEANRRGVNIVFKKGDMEKIMILAPEKHYHEAFENLLSNSIKYNKEKGTVTIDVQKQENHVLITVADTGIGIPKEAQSKIFSKFFRAPNAVLKETEGSGLGLSVVKSYLEEAKGTIRFESQENVGTTFFIEIPLQKNTSTEGGV